ncbi:hypothetical protein [Azospirillum griseum]|uniref:hypothetical protein n=1 Tax=Azospirillum griseum TaxID=2496639 RepID=UPI001315043A|nr:hypothetical protein [Azospirillum griseum]
MTDTLPLEPPPPDAAAKDGKALLPVELKPDAGAVVVPLVALNTPLLPVAPLLAKPVNPPLSVVDALPLVPAPDTLGVSALPVWLVDGLPVCATLSVEVKRLAVRRYSSTTR